MGQSFFIWNGIDCRSKGVIMRGPAAIIRAEERVRHVEIPGVAGDLTETEGENIYNSYIQTVSISVKGGFNVRNIYKWLRGAGYVTFSGEPDRKQAARVIGAITLNRVSRNIDHWAGEVQFYCQPFKEKLREETVSVTSSGATVKNDGDVIAYPKITVNAGAAGQDIVLAMGGKVLRINMTGMADTGCVVDCQGQVVTNYSGTANLTHLSSGEFPRLLPGNNTVTFVNASSLDIEKRERFL
jgi:phage-related protein